MPIVVRPIREDEFEAFRRVDEAAFQIAPPKGDETKSDSWARGELDRAFAAFDGDAMVGIGRNYSFDLTVPGGRRLPAGAVSWVGVLPTHRRRGVLTSILDALVKDSRDRGEPISMLTASEGAIYRRFGYGVAVDRVGCTIESAHGGFTAFHDSGRLEFVPADRAIEVFAKVYERTRHVVGSVSRPDFWWPEVLRDFEADTKFFVVHETDGVVDGSVFYSIVGEWTGGLSDRTVDVIDLQAVNDHARLALWRYLLDIDLTARVKCFQVPRHDPVRWALRDPRRLRVDFVNDGLYIRLLDIPAALSARAYEYDGHLTFSVDGASFELTANDGIGTCVATAEPASVAFSRDVIGALYLGQRRATEFVAPGGSLGDEAALHVADRLFATSDRAAMLSYF